MVTDSIHRATTPLTLEQALDACIGYARHRSHFDGKQKRFIQDAHEGRATDLQLEEQYELIDFIAQGNEEKYEIMAYAHKHERLLLALQDGRVRAWGYLGPYIQHDKKKLIEPRQWRYLRISEGYASGIGQIYTDLQFDIRPDSMTAAAIKNAASRSTRDEILSIYDDNVTELFPLTHDQRGDRIKQIAVNHGFETSRGYSVSNIRGILHDADRLRKPMA